MAQPYETLLCCLIKTTMHVPLNLLVSESQVLPRFTPYVEPVHKSQKDRVYLEMEEGSGKAMSD